VIAFVFENPFLFPEYRLSSIKYIFYLFLQGWDDGVIGMCVGESRKLTIPPALAYGSEGVGNVIPPCATLTFEVDLLDIA
jgi:hypothetical protein